MEIRQWIIWVRWVVVAALLVEVRGDTLGLADGYISLRTDSFDLKLVKDSQTLASLTTKGNDFDFCPFDYLPFRADNFMYHVGDVTFRYRLASDVSWTDGDSSANRERVTDLKNSSSSALASSDLGPTLPEDIPFSLTRQWTDEDGDLGLSFTFTNTADQPVEIGSLGFPIEFNNIFTNRSATDVQQKCSLTDPYIGLNAGFLRVTPVSGLGAALVVTPLGNTSFEAWRFLDERTDTAVSYQSQTYEGNYEWQVFSKAWAENEWKGVQPWNEATSETLQPGDALTVGLRFTLSASGIRNIESTVVGTGTPLAIGIPGYIIPRNMDATLILNSTSNVSSISAQPVGALGIQKASSQRIYTLVPAADAWGRVRVTIIYADGALQTVHYFITKPGPDTLGDLGHFLTTSQWYNDSSDPFSRAPSVISYDRSVNKLVLQDPRVWIAGLSDEAGAGSWLAATMKQAAHPNSEEIALLESFVNSTLSGTIQVSSGDDVYGVRKSTFFYQPDAVPGYAYKSSIDWSDWWSWNRSESYATSRAYDYVHITAAYWALYRVGRAYPSLVKLHTWQWYLNQAFQTVMTCMATDSNGSALVDYANVGLMGETVFGELLADLKRESSSANATALEAAMKSRATNWNTEADPFGSEQAWDSTGQEGVYHWSSYFGFSETATKAINSIIGYMPTVGHWGWNGNARRYWDNIYGGKLQRIERQIHHYGSGLNALPMLSQFKKSPNDTYLLRVGYGGMNGPLTNIDEDGFAAASFHSWPDTLAWDAYSGDYGPNLLGLVLGAETFIVQDGSLGYVAYGGNVVRHGDHVIVHPRDAVRHKVFVAPLGLSISIDAGAIEQVDFDVVEEIVILTLAQAPIDATANIASAPAAVVWLDMLIQESSSNFSVTTSGIDASRGGWQVPLSSQPIDVTIARR
ncbi:MAG: hypothetical protein M1819_004163 [Sarea resinae]|nr:MAG: hypothetical protein M1819_004163 [Sarea resinae]